MNNNLLKNVAERLTKNRRIRERRDESAFNSAVVCALVEVETAIREALAAPEPEGVGEIDPGSYCPGCGYQDCRCEHEPTPSADADLVERLRGESKKSFRSWPKKLMDEAARAIEARDADIASLALELESKRYGVKHNADLLQDVRQALAKQRDHAEQVERERDEARAQVNHNATLFNETAGELQKQRERAEAAVKALEEIRDNDWSWDGPEWNKQRVQGDCGERAKRTLASIKAQP